MFESYSYRVQPPTMLCVGGWVNAKKPGERSLAECQDQAIGGPQSQLSGLQVVSTHRRSAAPGELRSLGVTCTIGKYTGMCRVRNRWSTSIAIPHDFSYREVPGRLLQEAVGDIAEARTTRCASHGRRRPIPHAFGAGLAGSTSRRTSLSINAQGISINDRVHHQPVRADPT